MFQLAVLFVGTYTRVIEGESLFSFYQPSCCASLVRSLIISHRDYCIALVLILFKPYSVGPYLNTTLTNNGTASKGPSLSLWRGFAPHQHSLNSPTNNSAQKSISKPISHAHNFHLESQQSGLSLKACSRNWYIISSSPSIISFINKNESVHFFPVWPNIR